MGIMELFNQISSEKKTGPVEYIVVGLGNPGLQYQDTRHNAGFMAIDTIGDKKCLLMKPTTYMNNSGEAVVEALNFYKLGTENLIVIYDDISLEPSKLRIRRKGSDGGHNGIKSIIYLTGEDTFPRIKVGVGKKPHPQYNLADWVLSNFKADEIPLIKEACQNASESVELMVTGRINDAMNKFN